MDAQVWQSEQDEAYVAGLRSWLHQIEEKERRVSARGHRQEESTKAPGSGAVGAKDKGNACFKRKEYRSAVEWYTRSMDIDPMNAITVANRAMAHLQLKEYAAAEADSDQAITLDATYVKAYMRRGTARKALGKLQEALEDFEIVRRLEKENKQAVQEIQILRQMLTAAQKQSETAKKEGEERRQRQVGEERRTTREQEKQNGGVWSVSQKQHPEKDRKLQKEESVLLREHHTGQVNKAEPSATAQPLADARREQTPSTVGSSKPALDSSSILALSSQAPAEALKKPATVFEFERAWSNTKDDTEAFYRYFLLLDPECYARFFGNSMTPAIISSIIASLSLYGVDQQLAHSLKVLRHLPQIRRWRIILKKEDKEALKSLFGRIRSVVAEGRVEGVSAREVDQIRSLYAL